MSMTNPNSPHGFTAIAPPRSTFRRNALIGAGVLALGGAAFTANYFLNVRQTPCVVQEATEVRGTIIGEAPYAIPVRDTEILTSIGTNVEGQNIYVQSQDLPKDSTLTIANPTPILITAGDSIEMKVVGWRSDTKKGWLGACEPKGTMPYATPSQIVDFTLGGAYTSIGQDSAIANVVRDGKIIRPNKQ